MPQSGGSGPFFNKHLEHLQTDHIDYYLLHMLTDMKTWEILCSWGIREWAEEKRKSGQIRNVGFSFHGAQSEFLALLDAYDWDFCQIQYNYSDENYQAGVDIPACFTVICEKKEILIKIYCQKRTIRLGGASTPPIRLKTGCYMTKRMKRGIDFL